VNSVHALCHIADDSRMYGVLDNFSRFSFESFLGTLKGMVHKLHHVLKQMERRISEREVSGMLPECRTGLKHRHKCGPEIEGRPDLLQYGSAQVDRTYISSDRRDQRDCCFIVEKHICAVRNILAASCSDEVFVINSVYEHVEAFFDMATDSIDIGIYDVCNLSDEVFFSVNFVNVNENVR
jgi:hypothetical protein